LKWNQQFVNDCAYEPFSTSKFPDKKLAVLSCMDARLVELLPRAMNLKNGEAKMIKVAGAWLTSPYDAAMKSLLVGIALLKVEEVYVVGHYDCGMVGLHADKLCSALTEKGISIPNAEEQLACTHDELAKWLTGPTSPEEAVRDSVATITSHPLIPSHIPVHGLVIHPHTGKLDLLVDGREKMKDGINRSQKVIL
jgi:carbonic anhydrase